MKILGLSGSLRAESSNARLLRAAARLAPAGHEFTFFDRQIGLLPHYSPDLDQDGVPALPEVAAFRGRIAEAGGVLICCPEYGHGVPGSFKNALDWIVSSGEFTGKPVSLIMASASGAERAWAALRPTLLVVGARLVYERSLMMRRDRLAPDGTLGDPEMAQAVTDAVRALLRADGTGGS